MLKGFLPLDELKKTVEWARLSAYQRELFVKYVERDHDPVAAVKAIHNSKTEKSAKVTAARNFSLPVMRDVIARHFGETQLDVFQRELQHALRDPNLTPTRIQALKIMAKSLGLDESVVPPEPEGEVIGEKESILNGRRVKTTVVDLGEAGE